MMFPPLATDCHAYISGTAPVIITMISFTSALVNDADTGHGGDDDDFSSPSNRILTCGASPNTRAF